MLDFVNSKSWLRKKPTPNHKTQRGEAAIKESEFSYGERKACPELGSKGPQRKK
jgi:hypothetical protein